MELKELVDKSLEQSPEFKKKYDWWFVKRKRVPQTDWLLNEIVEALGHDVVKKAIEEKKQKDFYSLKK